MLEAGGPWSSRLHRTCLGSKEADRYQAIRGLVSAIMRRAVSSMLLLAGSHLRFEKAYDRPWG